MLTDLLWYLEAKQQHDGQKSAGLAGLTALILTFLMVWKWNDWIYPALDWMGLVGLAERVGLVTDSSHNTMINVLSMIFLLAFTFGLLMLVMVAVGMVVSVFFSSKAGRNIIAFTLAPVTLIPLLIYGYLWKKKQSAPAKETSSEKFMREYHEKEEAKHLAWFKEFESAPLVEEETFFGTRELKGYLKMVWNDKQVGNDAVRNAVREFHEWAPYAKNIELGLNNDRDNVLAYNNKTGKFHFVFPNPLPINVSNMYDQAFENEETLLNALHSYKIEHPAMDSHVFPCLEMEYQIDENYDAVLVPVANAKITPMIISGSDFKKFHVKQNMNMFRTLKTLNEREDVQKLLNRANLNAFILREIVDRQEIENDYYKLESLWPDMASYRAVFAGQVNAALRNLEKQGYEWGA